jgi:hypothetical protein
MKIKNLWLRRLYIAVFYPLSITIGLGLVIPTAVLLDTLLSIGKAIIMFPVSVYKVTANLYVFAIINAKRGWKR